MLFRLLFFTVIWKIISENQRNLLLFQINHDPSTDDKLVSSTESHFLSRQIRDSDPCYKFKVGDDSKQEFYSPGYPGLYTHHLDCYRVLEGRNFNYHKDTIYSNIFNQMAIHFPHTFFFINVMWFGFYNSFVLLNPVGFVKV